MNLFKRQQQVTVAEIHETFNTEVDRLLEEAGILKPDPEVNHELISKAERLRKLGFSSTKEVNSAKDDEKTIQEIKRENKRKAELKETIEYFQSKYPYKFITEESVKKICQKYGLIYGSVDRYKGEVPEKNLRDIENFKVNDDDIRYIYRRTYFFGLGGGVADQETILTKEQAESITTGIGSSLNIYEEVVKEPLEIAAPLSDFDTEGMELKNFKLSKIQVPDPVVLQPVHYKDKKHYLIVTAWGDESSDELVVNEKMN